MSLGIEEKRQKIASVYPGDGWRLKVQQMPTNQVCAIYNTMLARGTFNKKKLTLKPKKEVYQQMTIFDCFKNILKGEKNNEVNTVTN